MVKGPQVLRISCGTEPMAKRFAAISKSKEVMRRSRKDATAQDTSANKRMGQMKAWHHFTSIHNCYLMIYQIWILCDIDALNIKILKLAKGGKFHTFQPDPKWISQCIIMIMYLSNQSDWTLCNCVFALKKIATTQLLLWTTPFSKRFFGSKNTCWIHGAVLHNLTDQHGPSRVLKLQNDG